MPSIICDFLEPFGPIVAAPREDLDLVVGEMDLHSIAVEFDFVNPSLARGHLIDCGCKCRFNEAWIGGLGATVRRLQLGIAHRLCQSQCKLLCATFMPLNEILNCRGRIIRKSRLAPSQMHRKG